MVENQLIFELHQVCFAYPGGRPLLNNLDFHLRAGEKVGVVGSNGSGKTTFLHLLMGLLAHQQGEVKLFGNKVVSRHDFAGFRTRIGLLFQDADDQLFSPTVIEDVAFGPLNQGKSVAEAKALAMRVLARLDIAHLAERVTYQLSGGEKKMVSLATVLAMEPEVLLLDEPTTGLDEATRAKISEVLKGLDLAYVVISHDYDFLADVTGLTYYMHEGRFADDAGQVIHNHFHLHPFGSYPHQHSH
ncbi:MAG: energy-coupling factor ABC transporter ATP-binding protein [Desulfobulbaceae bacterium]|nr:energy-coupling factor ABC transporter ATP-binding protein [Desulfobulbaceae bacterium]HIJ79697.1 ABC transporter ATP-binding protein [Deltaproteobacteria bacterium]